MADHILHLQRTVGNQAVGAYLRRHVEEAGNAPRMPAAHHAGPKAAAGAQPAIQRVLAVDAATFQTNFGESKKSGFQAISQFLGEYHALIAANNAAIKANKKMLVGKQKSYYTKLELIPPLQKIEQECTSLLLELTSTSKKHFKQRVATKNLRYAVQVEIAQLLGTYQAPAPASPAQGLPPLPQVPSQVLPPLPQVPNKNMPKLPPLPPTPTALGAAPAVLAGKQKLIVQVGLPASYLDELPKTSVDLLVTAHDSLESGNLATADSAFVTLRSTHGGAINLVKSFMLRHHIGQVAPDLAKAITNPAYKEKDQGTVLAGATRADDRTNQAGQRLDTMKKTEQVDALPEFANLSYMEKLALCGYTSEAYALYNMPLRSDLGTDKFSDDQMALTKLTISSMNKLPPFVGRVFRHAGIFAGYKELNRPGAVVSDMAFMSSAQTQAGAEKGGQQHDVLEIITSKSGRDISNISVKDREAEVLFKPGTQFKVLARYDRDPSSTTPDLWLPQAGPLRDRALAQWALDGMKDFIQVVIFKEEI